MTRSKNQAPSASATFQAHNDSFASFDNVNTSPATSSQTQRDFQDHMDILEAQRIDQRVSTLAVEEDLAELSRRTPNPNDATIPSTPRAHADAPVVSPTETPEMQLRFLEDNERQKRLRRLAARHKKLEPWERKSLGLAPSSNAGGQSVEEGALLGYTNWPCSPEGFWENRRTLTTPNPSIYTKPFLDFISSNPTVFHAVAAVSDYLESAGFKRLSEHDSWNGIQKGGKYFVERNGSSLIAFTVGKKYNPGNGASVIAAHIDALTTRLKPLSELPTKAGYIQLGVAPYAGALNGTWWDRDLGVGGRVLVRNSETGKIEKRLVKLDWPIARIPTLAPHFGQAAHMDGANKETEMVPIIGLDHSDSSA